VRATCTSCTPKVRGQNGDTKTATNPITLYECECVSVDLNAAYTVRPLTAFVILDTISFYRAMHFSAKRGIAIACRLSVRLSVRPSVRPPVCDVGEL